MKKVKRWRESITASIAWASKTRSVMIVWRLESCLSSVCLTVEESHPKSERDCDGVYCSSQSKPNRSPLASPTRSVVFFALSPDNLCSWSKQSAHCLCGCRLHLEATAYHKSHEKEQSNSRWSLDSSAAFKSRQVESVCKPQLSSISRVEHLFRVNSQARKLWRGIPPLFQTIGAHGTDGSDPFSFL